MSNFLDIFQILLRKYWRTYLFVQLAEIVGNKDRSAFPKTTQLSDTQYPLQLKEDSFALHYIVCTDNANGYEVDNFSFSC